MSERENELSLPVGDAGDAGRTGRLADMLREQGESEAEILSFIPALSRLHGWQAPPTTHGDTARLLSILTPLLPKPSTLPAPLPAPQPTLALMQPSTPDTRPAVEPLPVGQAIRRRAASPQGDLALFLDVALAQVGLLRPTFWLASAMIALLGVLAVLSGLSVDQAFILRAVGPLLSVVSVNTLVRAASLRVLEMELSCPASPLRLTLARVVVVLAYDILLGVLMSLLLWVQGTGTGAGAGSSSSADLLALTLHWLAPLLLVAGAALLLSLKMHPAAAASTAYAGWLAVLTLALLKQTQGVFGSALEQGEVALLALGGCLLLAGLMTARKGSAALLPRN